MTVLTAREAIAKASRTCGTGLAHDTPHTPSESTWAIRFPDHQLDRQADLEADA